ncbi:MAG: phospho-N-acetylmuramoyl-pentapeptide-transferase [Candidatus Dormibacteria bacterium]
MSLAGWALLMAAKVSSSPSPGALSVKHPPSPRGLFDTVLAQMPHPWPPLWAFLLPLLVGVVVMPWAIGRLARAGMGQKIREEGPRTHMAKGGTPTSGGLAVIVLLLLTLLLLDRSATVLPALLAILLGGGLGLLDDLVTVKSRSWTRGLLARQRIVLQLGVGVVTAVVLLRGGAGTQLVPIIGVWHMGWLLVPFAAVVLAAAANAFNLTDGSDGLAPGVMLVVALVLALILRNYHHQTALVRLLLATAGALAAFLVYNVPPARVFLGGVGSEGLGMMLATVAIGGGFMWFLPLLAIVPLLETGSVITQVAVFKRTGRRVFKMSPLHHHFQLSGWSEWSVALVAWAVTCLGGTIGLLLARRAA